MSQDIATLAEFTDRVLSATDFSKLSNVVIEDIVRHSKPQYASFMLYDVTTLELVVEKRRGFYGKRSLPPSVDYCQDLERCSQNYGTLFLLPSGESTAFFSFFDPEEPHASELCVPFSVCTNYLGIINLGKKHNGKSYSSEDIHFLQVLTNFVSTATHKSKLCPARYISKGDRHVPCSPDQCTQAVFVKPRVRMGRGQENFDLLGNSPAMQNIRDIIKKVAVEDVPVLITGESGTGKELIARALHQQSRRANQPMIAMNCAALPDALVESELFGHEKGAFTGAHEQKKGKFEHAHHSTLFLDEIGDMSLTTQAKLLRVLQDGTFHRVGGNSPQTSDVRIIAATNKDLQTLAEGREFREDLFYRLNVVQIEVPPLRERREDIEGLTDFFFQYYNQHYNKHLTGFNDEAREWLRYHDYPGNVRELKNILERAIIMEHSDRITTNSFPVKKQAVARPTPQSSLEEIERDHILSVMQKVNNNKSAAARTLGIARKTLREKLQRYDIQV